MSNRFEQSTPPSIHDVYRGLPIGPGGVEPYIFRDRGRHRRQPARLPWQLLALIGRQALGRIRELRQRVRAGRSAGMIGFWPSQDDCR